MDDYGSTKISPFPEKIKRRCYVEHFSNTIYGIYRLGDCISELKNQLLKFICY